ncbi:hypothetical protein ACFSQU_17970 [Massilia sp. GCM10020059]|uniref:LemA protein n=1 Tax=Massilia agrisoli TaxID=2892444 RepID=A0ABS8IS63_9BURK|nr:hypothetical protein [Massilia agrisoli]MCC6071429.1 hypothetical protein [Massilia agrisoli]
MERIARGLELAFIGVITTVALLGIVLTIRHTPLWSEEAAGWAQAIGSVVAVGVAIYVSDRQSKSARDLMQFADETALRRHLARVGAVLEEASRVVKTFKDMVKGEGDWGAFQNQMLLHLPPESADRFRCEAAIMYHASQLTDIIALIEKIPMHELGPSSLVNAVMTVKNALAQLDAHFVAAKAAGHEFVESTLWNGVGVAYSFVEHGRSMYVKGVTGMDFSTTPPK